MITYGSTTLTSYNTITKIEVYYYKSTSSTDLAGGSWSTTKPTWENGKYIWQKIRTTYEGKLANGQFYSESDPVNITGQQGATGTAAYSYKLNASDTIVGRTKTGQYTVNEITFTATYKQGTGAVTAYAGRFKIETTLNGTDWTTTVSSTANESSKKFTIPENIIAIKCSLYQAGGLTVLLDIMTVPIVKDGVDAIGLRDTIPYYLASDKDTGVTRDEIGWSRYTPQLTADKKYLWVYYASRYSEGDSEPELIDIKDDVVSFENHGEISPSEGCVVDINPVQDCNGYDKPWIKGTGNNKLPSPKEETIILNGITTYCDGAGKYTLTGTATAATTIKFNLNQTFTIPPSTETNLYFFNTQAFSDGEVKWAFWNNTSAIDSWSLSLINRNSTNYSSMANKSCNTVGFTITSGTVVDMTLSPALLLKENTTFEPYENICPITGWTNIDINQYGKNWLQLPEYDEIKTYKLQASYHKVPVKVLPNTDYYLHTEYLNDYTSKGKNNCYVLMTASPNGNTDWKAIGHSSNGIVDGVMHSTSDGYLFLKVYQSCSQETYDELKNNCETMLAVGTTATAYEPYKKQDYIYDVRFDDNLSLIKTDNEPYQIRQNIVPTTFQVDRLEDEIVGGSIVWNQLQGNKINKTSNGVTFTYNEATGELTIDGTAENNAWWLTSSDIRHDFCKDHIYLIDIGNENYSYVASQPYWYFPDVFSSSIILSSATIKKCAVSTKSYSQFLVPKEKEIHATYIPQFFDLTQMFGTEIANYLYNLEQNEAGAGVAWFRKYFPNEYYEYNAGEIKSVEELRSHDMVGFNLFDKDKISNGYLNTETGILEPNTVYYTTDYIPVLKNQIIKIPATGSNRRWFYDINKNPKKYLNSSNTQLFNPSENGYIRVSVSRSTISENDLCINLSRDGKRDGEYEPYINYSYPLDSSLILRGIPKISPEGNLYYDGDRYKSDGTVTRKYGIVDLGTLTWYYSSTSATPRVSATVPDCKKVSNWYDIDSLIPISKYTRGDNVGQTADAYNKWGVYNGAIYFTDSSYTDATSFKTAMSGVYFVYELATPTTEKGAPYQSLQAIDPYGTEEYVTDSIIPVGHETKYYSRAVYGGQLDMTNGILMVDRARLTLTGDPTKEAWYLYSPDNYNADCFNIIIPNKKIGNSTSICDKFSNIITCWGANGDNKYGVYSDHPTLNRFYFRQPNADITTIDKWKEWLSENPVTVCYELADPIIYQLTPQELTMLEGQNYIYSDSGQTNIRYYDNQTSTEPRVDYTFMSAYDTAQMINNAVGTLEAPYTEVEWVESTGKQYVYLDWKPPIKTWGFEADFICRNLIGTTGGNVWNENTNADGYGTIFGTRNASAVNDCILTSYAAGYIKIGGAPIGDIGFERNKRIVMKMHGTTFTKPDGTTKTLTRLNETANKPYWNMTVFAYHQGLRQASYGGVIEPSSTRIYSLKFFDGDTLTVDLVGAIRKSDRTTGLYDKVSKHFYPAPGLLYGNEVGDIGEIASIKQSMLKTNPQTIVVNKNRTRMWEATVPFDHLEDGQKLTVTYSYGNVVNSVETEKLAGWTDTSSNQQVYLKLTLSNGNQTDWIPCYYSNTGRLTTHYGSGIPIVFTYRENMLAGASETSSGYAVMRGFYADANYDSNTIYTQYASAVKAGTNGVKRYTLIMRDSDNTYSSFINQANTLGTTKTVYTGGFILGKIYYSSAGAEYATGANTSSIWSTYQVDLRYDFNITTSGATALTLYKPVYLVGTVHDDDGLFYLDTTQWWTQTEPTSEDGKVYIFIGQAYSAYQSWLAVDNTAYQYYDGKFMPYETVRTLKSITTLQETLENQIDGKVETWCQINDPATAWTTADLKNQHDGDLWYYIGESNTTYKNNTTYKYTASTGKWTAYSASTDLFDRIDSKSTVYYGKPSAITQNLEVGDYLVDDTDGCSYRWDGSKWVKLTDYKTAIDNIEIGGKNLLLNSATEKTGASNVAQWMQWAISDSPLVANEEYMFSFDAKMSNSTDVFYIGFALNSSTQEIMEQEVLVTDTYKRYTYKVKTTKTNINSIIISNAKSYGHGNTNNSTGVLNIKNIKLEKGNKATKWTPAPEDIETELTTIKNNLQSQIDEKIQTYYQSSNPASAWTTTALRTAHDGDLWYYTGTTTTTYTKDNVYRYNGSNNTWTTYSASGELFDKVDGKSTIYYGTTSDTYTGVETGDYLIDANDGSSYRYDGSKWVKVTDYKSAIDNIEVGGRNLARNTQGAIIDKIGSAEGSRAEYAAFDLGCALPLNDNDNISISFDLYMIVRTANPYLNVYNSNNKGVHQTCIMTKVVSGNFYQVGDVIDKHIAFVSTIHDRESPTLPHDYLEFYSEYGSNNFFRISNLKVEKGNKPTAWTPAPEDVDASIATAQTTADTAMDRATAIYGTCSTPTGTAAKAVTCPNFVLFDGARIQVTFTNANTASAPTLNVNNTGAKAIYINQTVTSSSNLLLWTAGSKMEFVYDGTGWIAQNVPYALYGTCSTGASIAAKAVTCNEAVICKGTAISVNMTNTNTAANATMNVGSTVAKDIYANGAKLTTNSRFNWRANTVQKFVFDGQVWRMDDDSVKALATAYITEIDNDGIMVHPENDTTSGWSIANAIELFKSGISYIKLWIDNNIPKIRIGKEDSKHVLVDDDSVDIVDNNTTLASFGEVATIGQINGDKITISPTEITGVMKNNQDLFRITHFPVQTSTFTDITLTETTQYIAKNIYNQFIYHLKFIPKDNSTVNWEEYFYDENYQELNSRVKSETYHYNDIPHDGDGDETIIETGAGWTEITSEEASGASTRPQESVVITGELFEEYGGLNIGVETSTSQVKYVKFVVTYITQSKEREYTYYTFGDRNDYLNAGDRSFAQGIYNIANGKCSHAEGESSQAIGDYSHAECHRTKANGNYSHSEGYETKAIGNASHAEGKITKAYGVGSHAEGRGTSAGNNTTGNAAHAEGFSTIAEADYSHAQNIGTIAGSESQTVMGRLNVADRNNKYALIIGNGNLTNINLTTDTAYGMPSNAFTVSWEGNVEMALNTAASSGTTDADLYSAITALGWGNDVLI